MYNEDSKWVKKKGNRQKNILKIRKNKLKEIKKKTEPV